MYCPAPQAGQWRLSGGRRWPQVWQRPFAIRRCISFSRENSFFWNR
jgi:hypothetical protein